MINCGREAALAARANMLTPQAMLKQIDRRFEWLARAGRDATGVHRTLGEAVEWSYNLLTESEKKLWRRLSVFPSSWDLPAAEAICSGEADATSGEIFQTLIQLTEKSLVVAEEGREEPRWRLLETLRQFGRDRLAESGEESAARARHLAYFADWMEAIANTLDNGFILDYDQYIEPDMNNLRVALNWALDEKSDRAHALRLASAFCYLGMEYSLLKESEEWFRKALPLAGQPEHRRWRSILLHRGAYLLYLGRWRAGIHEAYQLAKEGERIARELDDPHLLASAIYNQWEILADLGMYEEARLRLVEAIEICRASAYQTQLNSLLCALANVLALQGKLDDAMGYAEQGYAIALKIEDLWGQGLSLRSQAATLRAQKKYANSLDMFTRVLDVARQMGDRIGTGITLANMSSLANALEDYAASGRYAQEAFVIFQTIGNEYQMPYPQRVMGYAALHTGDPARAPALRRQHPAQLRARRRSHRRRVWRPRPAGRDRTGGGKFQTGGAPLWIRASAAGIGGGFVPGTRRARVSARASCVPEKERHRGIPARRRGADAGTGRQDDRMKKPGF